MGTKEFHEICHRAQETFDTKPDSDLPCTFTGFRIERDRFGNMQINKRQHVANITSIPANGTYASFASVPMKLAWVAYSRIDILYQVCQLTKVTEEHFEKDRIRIINQVNKTIECVKYYELSIPFQSLDFKSICILGVSDPPFSNNSDLTFQMKYIVFLSDRFGTAIPFSFKIYKVRRVTRSVLAAELTAFADMFDVAYTFLAELGLSLNRNSLLVCLLMKSKSLFDIIHKGSRTSEKTLMVNIAIERREYH